MGVQVSRIADFVASHEDTALLVSNFGCFSKFSFENFFPDRTNYTNLCIAFLPYKAVAAAAAYLVHRILEPRVGEQVSRIADFIASHEDTAPLVSNFAIFL